MNRSGSHVPFLRAMSDPSTSAMLHGPGGLLATPGMGSRRRKRKWGTRLKDKQIKGNLYRSDVGRFSAGNGPPSAAPKKPRAARKPRQTDAERQQARDDKKRATGIAHATERATNRQKILEGLNIAPDGQAALGDLADGQQPRDPKAIERGGFVKAGLVEQASDGSYRMTASGRAAMAAAAAGDAGRAGDTISSARDRLGTRQGKQTAATARREAVAARRAETAKKRPAKAASGSSKQPEKPAAAHTAAPKPKRAARQSAPSAGSVGGSSSPKPKPKPEAASKPTINPALRDAAQAVSAGDDVTDAQVQQLVTNGLVRLNKDGEPILTAAGQRATMKALTLKQSAEDRAMFANMGSSGGGSGGSGGKATGGTGGLYPKGPSGKRTPQAAAGGGAKPAANTPTKADAQSALQSFRKRTNDAKAKTSEMHKLESQASQARRAGDKKRADELQKKADELKAEAKKLDLHPDSRRDLKLIEDAGFHMSNDSSRLVPSKHSTTPKIKDAPSSFTVYKDHTGASRWIARTTTAYRDRDGEIISEAALDADSQRMTASKQFGPLRYWHVGSPDPFDEHAPWGPGLDIGDCDYSVVIGRTRIESGTFRNAGIAQKMAAAADRHEMSPGFFHPLDQPDADGVFDSIRTFERSTVPTRYGRGSNLFTGFTVKEFRMELTEMERRFKAMYSELGLTPEQGMEVGQQLVATEKTAQAQGIAFKDSELPDLEINGVVYKAFPPKADAPPMVEEIKADAPPMVDETVVDDAPMDEAQPEGDYIGDMSWDEFSQKLSELLAPVLKMQDMVKAMGDAHQELKTMYGGVATKSDGVQAEIAALKARLAEIEGDQPATILPDEVAEALKSEGPAKPQEPERKQIVSTPERPWAGWGAQTFPELYAQNGETT